ncbi:aldehyde dehydrogenase [Nocardiopsis sp. L17-MgMaSL7]|uniref:aldehyde dehydrogenase family protein n=1 Tax=Nocardiopsis sp. L17-MgMaSL7 TaxID=1938893 RepID=UPI000D71C229|nr:aldehyde dehydrogenase [Nocardiopsis sp. L17-MgMaSL7]PWV58096.1 acyl-CoA reductase-like NAD-dependent aldehyde dehydrogenase [Nocardiopsis sp. L17-MgMaSL7]
MKTYPPFIAGREEPADKWIHVLRASALLEDAFGAMKLKRTLDRGGQVPSEDDRIVGRVGLVSKEQSARALAEARRAQRIWARVPFKERLAVGEAVNARFVAHAEEFVEVLIAEGHPRRLAQWEVAGIIQGSSPETLAVNAEMMSRTDRSGQRETRVVRKPDGVVCISPPQNAAVANSLLGLPTLVGGNAVVIKAPRSVPFGTAWAWRELIAPVMEDFGAPPGVFSIVCDAPRRQLDLWLNSPDVDDIMFFGSSDRGLAIERECVTHGKKPVLELAGNDGLMVWKDAEVELAARAAAECFYGSAQICMVPKYALVHPDVAEAFTEALRVAVSEIRPGMPEEEGALLSPVIKTEDFFATLNSALDAGATLVSGGDRLDHSGTASSSGVFVSPTLLRVDGLETARGLDAVREETFFPLLPVVVPRRDEDAALLEDMLAFLDSNAYGLRNSLWAQDPLVIDAFCEGVQSGGLLKVNDSHLGFVGGLPTHGGTGRTGGAHGECNFPMLRTTHLQGISIATAVTPRESVFDSVR